MTAVAHSETFRFSGLYRFMLLPEPENQEVRGKVRLWKGAPFCPFRGMHDLSFGEWPRNGNPEARGAG